VEPQRSSDVDARPSIVSAAHDGPLNAPALLARFLEASVEPEALERMLVSLAVHPEGAGCVRAHLMRFNPERERLEGTRLASATAPASALERTLEWARFAESSPGDAERMAEWQAFTAAPDRLSGAPAEAWRGGGVCVGPAGEADFPWRGAASVGAVLLRRGLRAHALLVGEWCGVAEGLAGAERLEALARTVEATWVALDPASEARRRAQHAEALGEFVRAGVSSLNLAEALHLAARLAVQGTGAHGAAVWLAGATGTRLEVTHGPAGQRERIGRVLQPLAEEVIRTLEPRVLHGPAEREATREAVESPSLANAPSAEVLDACAVAARPLVAYGRALGALAVYHGNARVGEVPAAFARMDLEFFGVISDALALVLEQARRREELQRTELANHELRARVRREERLASIGERASRLADEVRNPIASIGAFARRVHRELEEGDPHREYLEIVIRESERLECLLGEQVAHASLQPLRLRMESLNAVVQDVLRQSGEMLVRRRVRLLKRLDPELPALLIDPERMRQVLHNVLGSALESVPIGGRIRVESRRAHPHVVVDVAHDGPHQPGDVLERLFVPFATRPNGAAGLGLGLVQRIVREHGGEIRVRSEAEWTTIVSFTLPIPDNQDRRQKSAERRQSRADRRQRFPDA
jgi:signal transduction histidine kinase